ncbi:MAG: hypothetical protein E6J91_01735 [Deltaproteobacteria bacterium]|nr:MAG: hypothetical protein E6J91_01735 [Deltaproteobacteria bacterium]
MLLGAGGIAAREIDVAGDDVGGVVGGIALERELGEAGGLAAVAGIELEGGELGQRVGVRGVERERLHQQLAGAAAIALQPADPGAEDVRGGGRGGLLERDQAVRPGVVELALGGEHGRGDAVDVGVVAVEGERGAHLDPRGGEAACVEQDRGERGVRGGVVGIERQGALGEVGRAAVVAEPALDLGLLEQDADLARPAHSAPDTTMIHTG